VFEKWFKSSGFGEFRRADLEPCWHDAHGVACMQAVLILKKKQRELLLIASDPHMGEKEREEYRGKARVLGEVLVAVAEMKSD